MKVKATQVYNGERHYYTRRKNGSAVIFTRCCDCGLTHLEEITPRKTKLAIRVWRQDDLTAYARRRNKKRYRKLWKND